ncbi:MAG: extracellular solute-binding protein, partial [Solirubrobacteraceae bacterium]
VYGAVGAAAVAAVVVLLIAVSGKAGDDAVADPSWLDDAPSGKVVYCTDPGSVNPQRRSLDDFNRSPEHGTARAELGPEIPLTADRQREAYLERISSGDCDVLYLDVIYTPEFASRGLLRDVTSYLERDDLESSIAPETMRTTEYGGKRWAVPKQFDAGVLYYRRDRVRPPRTWKGLAAAAEAGPGERPGLRLQLDAYEGLTVTFLELAYAAGAKPIVSDDGRTANLDQGGTREALELLRSMIARRAVPRSVTRLTEENSLNLFSLGRATFLRSWPYVEARLREMAEQAEREGTSSARARRNTVENLGVVALPPWSVGGRRVAILGGHNLVIPRTAKNPEGALHLIRFMTSTDQVLRDAKDASLAPVLPALNDRPEVAASPALMAIRDDVVELRPPITSYWRVSRTISMALRRILSSGQGRQTFPEELRDLQADVQRELDGRQ